MKKMARIGHENNKVLEWLPQALLLDILSRLDIESLCSLAPVCRALNRLVSQVLSSVSILDLSGFGPTVKILDRILKHAYGLRSLILDCSQLEDSAISVFTKENLEELVLTKCYFSTDIFLTIGLNCKHLRSLALELIHGDEPHFSYCCNKKIDKMFNGCLFLESLSIKFHDSYPLQDDFNSLHLRLPKRLKSLLVQSISNLQAEALFTSTEPSLDINLPQESVVLNPLLGCITPILQSLTLVLDIITDELVLTLCNSLHHLAVLCLEDNPQGIPLLQNDLSDTALQSLSLCKSLIRLSLSRSQPNSFKRITDVGVLVLAEGCNGLESIRFGGFSKVTDAGYISILQCCQKLKKFEVVNGHFLSDLAFHDLESVAGTLVELVLISCSLLTGEMVDSLASCEHLKSLHLGGCRSVGDHGLHSIAKLRELSSLDLSGADVTDSGLSALGLGCSPIVTLCLRGCKRVSDRGFRKLLAKDNLISKTLSTLELGSMAGVSDETIFRIVKTCRKISHLCIRHCFFVTDASVKALGLMQDIGGERRSIKRLDLYNCVGLSVDMVLMLSRPYFRGLRWLGIGNTKLHAKERARVEELCRERPGLSVCVYGCQMGCRDAWFVH
ncbi:hypothetical protein HPP92_018919 [Vanilla planifolia]|uniref:F-box domain-containing protein n=1 Tax=Vanilla planifolia TaxID=51239 RepID=A0A835QCZ0_VANPL|nr:hypothetical protein HPP92_018919 [Vanilla planifolia]